MNGTPSLCLLVLIMLACFAISKAVESDVSCLRSIKESLEDPLGSLSNWNFDNINQGFICGFTGVECWNPNENRVLNIRLPGIGLRGPFPMGIRNCDSLTGLDLSRNYLSGPIPSFPAGVLAFITALDLSSNNLSGPIPPTIANFSFINVLRLDNNHLTGRIPPEFSGLRRLRVFSVANNGLSGPVPIFPNFNFSAESYANNPGLCGGPLNSCNNEDRDTYYFFSGFAVGFPIFTLLTMLFMFFCWPRPHTKTMKYYRLLIKKLERRKNHLIPKGPQIVIAGNVNVSRVETKVTAMEKYIRRFSLLQIETATNNFDDKNVIGYGNMGVMYTAVFPNGLQVALKRLHRFESFDEEFLSEIEILGRLPHTNLVPLLGFCFEMEKKFLAYEYISNGTLHHWLHHRPEMEAMKMKWNLRLKIAVGVARGLSWLHHHKVAHRKISSNGILLDDKFEPKISNFGNAIILMNSSGTPYKEDVYSFGILLLELVTGKEPSTWINSPTDDVWSRDLNLIDECLMGEGFDEEICETLKIAENCVHPRRDEATSMVQVYQAMCAIGISRHEISVDSCILVENDEGDM